MSRFILACIGCLVAYFIASKCIPVLVLLLVVSSMELK